MNIGQIENYTRVFGPAPGTEDEVASLAVRDVKLDNGQPAMESAWYPTADEIRRMAAGVPVILSVWGNVHPPVALRVGE
jgi:hypothetical protein